MRKKTMTKACAFILGASSVGVAGSASAEATTQQLTQQIEMLQKQIEMLRTDLNQVSAQQKAQPLAQAAPAASESHAFLERKPGDGVTFFTRGGEISLYGNLDMSVDDS